jgi:hypothetical protein
MFFFVIWTAHFYTDSFRDTEFDLPVLRLSSGVSSFYGARETGSSKPTISAPIQGRNLAAPCRIRYIAKEVWRED